MTFKQIVLLHFIGILVCIILISVCLYESYRIDKSYEDAIDKIFDDLEKEIKSKYYSSEIKYLSDELPGRWYKLELRQPAHCDDFPSWATSAFSRRCYNKEDCLKFWSTGSYYVNGVEVIRSEKDLPCHIAMWNNINYNREFCDFKEGDEIWFWREE